MSSTQWIVLVSMIIYIGLGAAAFKFPRGRADWKKDRLETLYMALSAGVFLMLLFLLWYVSAVIDWPPALTIILWASGLVLMGLVLVGMFAPRGIRLSFTRKEKKAVEEEE